MKRKVCFVVQRYGREVNGGAELQCRQMAEHIADIYDLTVLTTKAVDYVTWKNEYTADEEMINDVRVVRCPVKRERNMDTFSVQVSELYQGSYQTEESQIRWMEDQGPYSPSLLEYIKEHKDEYEVFVFFTYLYYPTVLGMREVAEKAILVPEAHDEPFLYMGVCRKVFSLAQAIFYNTEDERALVETSFPEAQRKSDIGGIGIDIPENIDIDAFRRKYNLKNYMIYAGRIDIGKSCHILFEYFDRYKKENGGDLKLVLMGKSAIKIPKRDDIVNLGFVSEEDKYAGIADAEFLILPSEFESLSIVVLEAFAVNVPVVVNGACDVLKSHCISGNAGLYYESYEEFAACINYMLSHSEERDVMGKNGRLYVEKNYEWPVVTAKLCRLIDYVAEK